MIPEIRQQHKEQRQTQELRIAMRNIRYWREWGWQPATKSLKALKIMFSLSLGWFVVIGFIGGLVMIPLISTGHSRWLGYLIGTCLIVYIAVELGWGGGKEINKSGL